MPRFAHRRAILLIAAAITAAGAQPDPWLKITSVNFELYTTGSERSGRDLIRHFEQVRSFFVQAFGDHLPDAKPACIIAFRNEKEFDQYRPTEFASAFFHAGIAHDFIVMSNGSIDHYPVAVHEFTHMMVHESGHEYRSEEHTSELQSLRHLVCRLLLESKEQTSELQSPMHLASRLLVERSLARH